MTYRSSSHQTNSCPLGTHGESCTALQEIRRQIMFSSDHPELDNPQFFQCWHLGPLSSPVLAYLNRAAFDWSYFANMVCHFQTCGMIIWFPIKITALVTNSKRIFQCSIYYYKTISIFNFQGDTDIILIFVTQVTLSSSVILCTYPIKKNRKCHWSRKNLGECVGCTGKPNILLVLWNRKDYFTRKKKC